jgi:glutamate formiminotransferase/glutamate formiminotransferase/formiminotetrahydrofolate cyclodeaminase
VPPRTLLAVPNVSEGTDRETIGAIARAMERNGGGVRLLDVHSDADHDRSVFTFAAGPGALAEAMLRLAHEAVARIDLSRPGREGQHPHVGVLDVAPVVYLEPAGRGAACAEALVIAERLGEELEIPVLLYGELTAEDGEWGGQGRARAEVRRGGLGGLAKRLAAPEGDPQALRPDFGPARIRPERGAALVAARPPLVAFNVELAPPATVEDARRIAALVREGGEHGLPGLRAIGVELAGGRGQVSMNVERPYELPLSEVVRALAVHAPLSRAELVGLAPAAAFADFPAELPLLGFDPDRHLIENALGC